MTSGCQILNRSTAAEIESEKDLSKRVTVGSSRCYGTQLCDEAGNEDFAVSEADMKCHLQLDLRGKNGSL